MTTWATAADVERAAQRWSDAQKECRTYGHPWRAHTVTHRPGIYTEIQRCDRCQNTRRQEVNDRGYPLGPWMIDYRPGYLLRNVGRLGADGKAVLRLSSLMTRAVIEEEYA